MPAPLAVDARGQQLLAFRDAASVTASARDDRPCPLSLVVVSHRGSVLLGLNRWRREWELPGGGIDGGETPRAAAARELAEETGLCIPPADLRFAGLATFRLTRPEREELGAVFAVELETWAAPHPSDELVDVRWADPASPPEPWSPIDLAIARAAQPLAPARALAAPRV